MPGWEMCVPAPVSYTHLDVYKRQGDSNTVRYTMYADDPGTAFSTLKNNIGVVSMGAGSITTLKCEKFKGDSTLYTLSLIHI